MIRRAACRAVLALLLMAAAPAAPPAAPSAPDGWLPRDTADLLVLDKVSARSNKVSLRVGQAADNVSLSITLRGCAVRPPDQAQDAAAYLDIKDSRPGAPGFHGWVLRNEPGLNMLEHPVYDVRLVGCR